MMNANMIAPHCLIERHGSASRFQDIFVDPRKWFRRRSELFRRFNRAPGPLALASRAMALADRY
jgi:hypothetical protein